MATDFDFAVVVEPNGVRMGESVLAEAHRLIETIESSLSEFRESALVYRLNHSLIGEWISLDEPLSDVFAIAREVFRASEGAFSPFARSRFAASFDDLEFDSKGRRVRRTRDDLLVGFGAVGKGYALDRAAALLEREGFSNFRLGAGGSSWVFRGFGPDDSAWEIAWAWGKDSDGDFVGQSYRLPGGRPIAIGVSGTVEKGEHFQWRGTPLRVTLRSAFASARTAAEADAFSTALMVGATREGEKFLTKLPSNGINDLRLAYVDLENQMIYNQGFDTLFLREGRKP